MTLDLHAATAEISELRNELARLRRYTSDLEVCADSLADALVCDDAHLHDTFAKRRQQNLRQNLRTDALNHYRRLRTNPRGVA